MKTSLFLLTHIFSKQFLTLLAGSSLLLLATACAQTENKITQAITTEKIESSTDAPEAAQLVFSNLPNNIAEFTIQFQPNTQRPSTHLRTVDENGLIREGSPPDENSMMQNQISIPFSEEIRVMVCVPFDHTKSNSDWRKDHVLANAYYKCATTPIAVSKKTSPIANYYMLNHRGLDSTLLITPKLTHWGYLATIDEHGLYRLRIIESRKESMEDAGELITISFSDIPFVVLLQIFSDFSNVPVYYNSKYISTQRLNVVFQEMPAHQMFAEIADIVGYDVKREADGFHVIKRDE